MSKIAFVYPGQGTQYVGMGKELYENNEKAKKIFDRIFSKLDFDLKKIMFEGAEEELKNTANTQPAIVSMSLVLTELLKEKGIRPDFVAGHSVGEFAAFGAAEYLSSEDATKLVSLRGKIMNNVIEKVDGTMAAIIGLEAEKIKEILKNINGIVEAVNFNEPKQTVIAGERKAIEDACIALKEAGARRAMPLAVAGPFHSSLMKEAGEELRNKAEEFSFKIGEIRLIGNTTAEILGDETSIKKEIYEQSFGPVKWVDTVKKMKELGVIKIYEIGPGKVLTGLIKKIDKEIEIINIETIENLKNL